MAKEYQKVSQMRQDRTHNKRMQKCERPTRSYRSMENKRTTYKYQMEPGIQDQRNRSGKRPLGPRGVGKRRGLPVRDGLRSRPERKPIIVQNFYAKLNNTESLEREDDHIMIKVVLQGKKKKLSINAMIDSGATEDFIDQEVCRKHQISTIAMENPREIYLADGNPSDMGPVTHIAKVPMTIGNHQELATLQVANLQNHEVILGMPWLKGHNPKIDWEKNKITFDSERCTTWCLDKKSSVYGIPEAKAREENLITRFSEIHAKEQRLRVKRINPEARIPTKGSQRAAGHDLYTQEAKKIPAKGQAIIGTRIAIGLPPGTYGRIAPRSGLAAKHALTTNAGVIDADYTGEVKIIMVNYGEQDYEVQKGDKIAQLIVERIMDEEIVLVKELDITERGAEGFGSSDTGMSKQVGTGANLLTKSPHQNSSRTSLNSRLRRDRQETPRPGMMTQQVRTSADLLTKHSRKVTARSEKPNRHA